MLAGCASNPITAPPPTIPVAQAAVSPPPAQQPAGTVQPFRGTPVAAIFDAHTAQLLVLGAGADPRAPATVTIASAQHPPRVIALPGPATAIAGDGHGSAYLAGRGGYFVVDVAGARTSRVAVQDAADIEFTAIARRTDGTLMLGSADGAVYTLAADTAPQARIVSRNKLFARVDAIAVSGDTAVVLDRGQTSVTSLGRDGRSRYSLRAGEGATTMAVDPRGLVLVADTRGGQLLVYAPEPLMLRQAYPVRESPYGLAGSAALVWVSQTGTNTVIGYDLTTGIPVEKVRYPTVRQPNALAFDDTTGALYVVSGADAGIQIIEHAAVER